MDIHIEESRGTILIKQKWRYFWLNSMNTSRWTYSEKQKFHIEVDNLIWNSWGKYFFLKVKGNSDFAIRNAKKRWDVNFDIEWVQYGEHWKVNVTKYPSNHLAHITSGVDWNNKIIKLDTKDTSWRRRVRAQESFYQYPIAHEFGHAVGNSIHASSGMHGDEYNPSSNYFKDKNSLMNIGNRLKDRHLDYILRELNTMVSNSKFSKY
ncbi:hypothetical protein [Tenacibaculum maritimum]|uniref:hypothetical protein n=1 Tax=Tenacibaculum maritimum TaxID=107401 RepID=UPI0013301710|nr:hypothetical protein [Tenacibaculum maritimum]